jgi:hypothetical protein
MRFEKTSPTELRRTAEAVAREGSIRKASIALGVDRSTIRRRLAAYNTLPSDQIPNGAGAERTVCALPSDQTPDGAPACTSPSDQASNGAPAFTPPPGSHLHWCDLTSHEGWERVAEDGWATRQRVIRGELIEEQVRVLYHLGRVVVGGKVRSVDIAYTTPALRTYVAGAGGLPGDSWLEIRGETARLIYPSCERIPRIERFRAVLARIGAYAIQQI